MNKMSETEQKIKNVLDDVVKLTGGSYFFDSSLYGMGFQLSWLRPLLQYPPDYHLGVVIADYGNDVVYVACGLTKPGFIPQQLFSKEIGLLRVQEVDLHSIVIDAYDLLNNKCDDEMAKKVK